MDTSNSEVLDNFEGATLLITGGTGSFGYAFVNYVLKNFSFKKVIVFSRDEMKQWEMANNLSRYSEKLRFFLGDVRDEARLRRALKGVDYVVHAAAMKIVSAAEYNPFECIKTNVIGAMNLVEASIDCGVKKVIALSTDKASSPVNLYGASKLASDKVFVSGNAYSGNDCTSFSVVRYGNVMGSRGSVIPHFIAASRSGEITVTDARMTRFMITIQEGVELVVQALMESSGCEIYVKKIPSANIMDIVAAVAPNATVEFSGVQPGEKLHEEMIGEGDARTAYEYRDHYKIFPETNDFCLTDQIIGNGIKVPEGFRYASDTNQSWMSVEEIKSWVDENLGQ